MQYSFTAIADAEIPRAANPVFQHLLDTYVDASAPVHIPLYFTATNLTRKRTEMFIVRGTSEVGAASQQRLDAILAPRKRPVRHPVVGADVRSALNW